MIKKLKHITVICKELYAEKGASAVYDYVNEFIEKQDSTNISYKECTGCEASTPHWHSECLICGLTNNAFTFEDAKRLAIAEAQRKIVQGKLFRGDDETPESQDFTDGDPETLYSLTSLYADQVTNDDFNNVSDALIDALQDKFPDYL